MMRIEKKKMPVALVGRDPLPKPRLPHVRPAVHHKLAKEAAERNAFHLQARLDRDRKERRQMYAREYNMIAGRLTGTGTADVIRDTAIRNFVATHGERHLPR
jgi:hypothetical protein